MYEARSAIQLYRDLALADSATISRLMSDLTAAGVFNAAHKQPTGVPQPPPRQAPITPEERERALDEALSPEERAACDATGMSAREFFAARCGWGKETLEAKGARLGLATTDIEVCRQTGCDPEMFAEAKAKGR
jgi:hypothetical protein